MPLIRENANSPSAVPDPAAPPAAGAPVCLEAEDLALLRLLAAGRRHIDTSETAFSSTIAMFARRRRLCGVLAADNSEHLAALSTVYRLVTREHLPAAPTTPPHMSKDEQTILDLIVAGWDGSGIAARLQCDVAPVLTAIAELAFAFRADNPCQLAAHAVLAEAVTGRAVGPRFPARPLSGLPPFPLTVTSTGFLLHTAPQPPAESAHRSPARNIPAVRKPDPAGPDRRTPKDTVPIPPELTDWVSNHIGRHRAWALPNDVFGARSWRMSSPEGIIELRIPPTHRALDREVSAHRTAISRLDPGLAPRLIGFDPRLRALLTREPRGERVDDTPKRGLHLRETVHEQAGRLLRTLHQSTPKAGDRQAQAAAATLHYIDYLDRVLDRIDSPVLDGRREDIRRRLPVLREALPRLPGAFCHGSFGSGAWRWQRSTQSLALTGFTSSQMMAAVTDFARPSLLWTNRPSLQDAFTRGYGRPLDHLERTLLGDFALLAAIEDLWHTIRLNDTQARRPLTDAVSAAMDRLPGHP